MVVVVIVPLLPPSAFRDGRDLAFEATAASAKVARAGVEGLLARPLFVFTVVSGVGGNTGIAVSFFGSRSSTVFATLSFLLPFGVGSGGGGGASVSVLTCSGLLGGGMAVSFGAFVSVGALAPLLCGPNSGVPGGTPFGLFEAADGGRCFAESLVLAWAELCRARDEAGRAWAGRGTGELRATFAVSGKVPTRGEDATDGDMAAAVLLREIS